MKDRDLFSTPEPKPIVRSNPKMPILRDEEDDEILPENIFDENRMAGAPKKINFIARHSKGAIVAWTPAIGWCVYAENKMLEQRAFYFREDVDDPGLSFRCMSGIEP
jgi:hypothetical protein